MLLTPGTLHHRDRLTRESRKEEHMSIRKGVVLAAALGLSVLSLQASAQSFTEGFDTVVPLPAGWVATNNSNPVGTTTWFQGNDTVFPSQGGATTSYIGANFNATTGAGNISVWLLTPQKTFANGDTLTFYTRKATPAPTDFPDRLQVRLSTAGASTDVGATDASVGVFTTLLQDINPTLVAGGYPVTWTQFTITLSGLPAGTNTGRFAFRYFVTNGGPAGANSDYIGIDTFSFTSTTPVELQSFSVE
jgi:hypothetical protein